MLINVRLYLWGDKLDPQRITEILGVTPSESRAKGETSIISTGKVVTAKIGFWCFSTRDTGLKSLELAEHIELLRSQFGASWTKIVSLPDVQDACVDIFIAISEEEQEDTTCYFEMSPKNVPDLQQVGLRVRFAVAFTGTTAKIHEEP